MNYRHFLTVVFIAIYSALSFGQRAREIQVENEPTDWSNPWNIALCVIIPILLVIGGVLIRNRSKKK